MIEYDEIRIWEVDINREPDFHQFYRKSAPTHHIFAGKRQRFSSLNRTPKN